NRVSYVWVKCQQLTAVKDEESSLEGSTVTLTYKYSKAAAIDDYFFWYRQHPGKPPELLLYHYGTQNETTAGLSAAVSDDKKQISMKISSAAVSDSAVYYCAVRPTVTGNSKTLYKNLWRGTKHSLNISAIKCILLASDETAENSNEVQCWIAVSAGNSTRNPNFHWFSQHHTSVRVCVSLFDRNLCFFNVLFFNHLIIKTICYPRGNETPVNRTG
uniref:Ig-like domain-containing protein n=1 Tax=Amphiprion ocellaris TaxID=80972 RepID=A0AAQ5ZE56_AMPOC